MFTVVGLGVEVHMLYMICNTVSPGHSCGITHKNNGARFAKSCED